MTHKEAYELAKINGPSKELEKIITTHTEDRIHVYEKEFHRDEVQFIRSSVRSSSYYSYCYSQNVLKGPFPEGEEEISKSGALACEYAVNILKGPFPEGEWAIAHNAYASYSYSLYATRKPFPLGEIGIAYQGRASYRYALRILRGPFQLGENSIIRHDPESLDYQFRFNRHICTTYQLSQCPLYALAHALMIGGRFPEGEPAMKASPRIWKRYQEFIDVAL